MEELKPSPAGSRPTLGWASRYWMAALTSAGIKDAGADVRRLVAAVLDVPAAQVLAQPERVLTPSELTALSGHMVRRARHEPVSRILCRRDFYGRTFAISPATLDPRPDTETVVEAALEIAREEGWHERELDLLDIGTGTGCLLLTLLCELPRAKGTGTDISPAALAVARANALSLGADDRASWLIADALETVSASVHMLVSNPPYVRSGDIAHLDTEVCNFDPEVALDGGADGLSLYRRLAARIAKVVPNGWALLEVGYDQADAVVGILSGGIGDEAVAEIRTYPDVAGRKRCVAVKTRAKAYA